MKSPTNSTFADANDDEIFFEPDGFSDTIPYSPIISLGDNYQVSRWTEDSVFFHNNYNNNYNYNNNNRRKSSIPRYYKYFTRDYPKPWLDYLYEKKGYIFFCLSHSNFFPNECPGLCPI